MYCMVVGVVPVVNAHWRQWSRSHFLASTVLRLFLRLWAPRPFWKIIRIENLKTRNYCDPRLRWYEEESWIGVWCTQYRDYLQQCWRQTTQETERKSQSFSEWARLARIFSNCERKHNILSRLMANELECLNAKLFKVTLIWMHISKLLNVN